MSFLNRQRDQDYLATDAEEPRAGFALNREAQVGIAFAATFVLGLICALTVVVPALLPKPAPAPQAVAVGPDFSVPTAREAYVPAVELIRQTDPGAQLASSAGAWTPAISAANLEAGRTGWTFSFFLPSTGEMATVVVDQGHAARLVGLRPWQTPPELLPDTQWRADSPQVMALLLEQCAATAQAAPDVKVEMRLSTAAENRTMLWQARVESEEDPLAVCEVVVDGITGLVR